MAYVELAKSHRAHCEVMFRVDLVDPDDPALIAAGNVPTANSRTPCGRSSTAEGLDAELDHAAWLCWSAIQGLVTLEPKIVRINEHRGGSGVTTSDLVRGSRGPSSPACAPAPAADQQASTSP